MSREHKYRFVFKHADTKDINFLHFTLDQLIDSDGDACAIINSMRNDGWQLIAKDEYIGFDDTKGQPIFRHSIVQYCGFEVPEKHWRRDNNFYIEWSEKHACYYPINCIFMDKEPSRHECNYELLLRVLDKCILVGNIHQNPELLNKE